MRMSRMAVAGAAATTALAISVAGCGGNSTSSSKSGSASATSATSSSGTSSPPASPAPAQPGEYGNLLIQAGDINAPVPFTAGPPTNNPNGQPGVATTFKDEDGSHVIKVTIQVYADPDAATDALNAAKGQQGGIIKDPTTQPSNIGTGGTLLLGNTPDRSKGVTILLFTEGKAFATLEFDGPSDSLAPPEFVNDVGQKQDAVIKKGLGG
jgi:maltose-binding protein MalE